MKKKTKHLAFLGLAIIGLVLCIGIFAGFIQSPAESLVTSLAFLPFAVGAIKVRDEMEKVRTIKYLHASATTKDTIYIIDGMPMLAVNSAGAGEANLYVKSGLIEYAKLNTQVWVAGDKAFWDAGNSRFGNLYDPTYIFCGYIAEAAANPTTTGFIILMPQMNRSFGKATTDATAGAITYTMAMLLGGIILRDPNGAARADLTPTAALIVAGIPGCIVGSSFEFTVRNTADAAETITLTQGDANVTMSGTMTVAQNNTKRFLAVVTNATAAAEAVTVYSLGTIVH
jgi:predicted RecA/RadA family phage recombinase